MPIVNGLPTYGNWGGPGWSAGRVNNGPLSAEDMKVRGVDALDK